MSKATENQPDFEIRIDGTELPRAIAENIVEIDVEEAVGHLARSRIHIRNWDPDVNKTEQDESEESRLFALGKDITILMGWTSDLSEVFDGIITAADIKLTTTGYPTLELTARCRGIMLAGSPKNAVWTDTTDVAAVESICSAVGLQVEGTAGVEHPCLVQYDASDWEYVGQRARALGLQHYVRGKKLNFTEPSADGAPASTLTWTRDLLEFHVSQDLGRALDSATATAWNPDDKTTTTATVKSDESTHSSGHRESPSSLLKQASMSKPRAAQLVDSGPLGESELQAWSRGLIDRRALTVYHGSGTCLGDPAIRIDGLIEVKGVGQDYDGELYVTRVRHRLTPASFRTTFSIGTPPVPVPDHRRSYTPLLPANDSLVIATVESFKDEDKKQGRVSIKLPWMAEDAEAIWARLASAAAGPSRGFVYIPEPGDEVVVTFLNSDPRFPVVLGALWNGQDAPPDTYDPEKNDKRSIVSRSGHKLVFDDTDSAEQILVESQAGQRVLIDDTSGSESIELEDYTGNTMKMDAEGIALTASTGLTISLTAEGGTIELSASQITATADMTAEIKANTKASVTGSAQLELNGAQVSINGDAMIQAQAPMIKLN